MKPLPRITPAEVLEAYRKTGLRPIRELYISDELHIGDEGDGLCGCPLGALYLANHPRDRNRDTDSIYVRADEWADKTYGVQFTLAFTAAFDRGIGNLEITCPYSDERSVEGWNDGRAVAFAVLNN